MIIGLKMKEIGKLRFLIGMIFLFSFVCLSSCKPSGQDIVGIYLGCITETAERNSEYFLQLYSNNQFALRMTPYESPVKSLTRQGTWTFDGTLLILVGESEKDLRFLWESAGLKNEASAQAFSGLVADQLSLKRITW